MSIYRPFVRDDRHVSRGTEALIAPNPLAPVDIRIIREPEVYLLGRQTVDPRVVAEPVEVEGDGGQPQPFHHRAVHRPRTRMTQTSRATLRSTLGTRLKRLIDGWRFSSSWMGISSTR